MYMPHTYICTAYNTLRELYTSPRVFQVGVKWKEGEEERPASPSEQKKNGSPPFSAIQRQARFHPVDSTPAESFTTFRERLYLLPTGSFIVKVHGGMREKQGAQHR